MSSSLRNPYINNYFSSHWKNNLTHESRSNCFHHYWVQTLLIGPPEWTWFLSINMIDFDKSSGAFSFLPTSSQGKKNKTQIEPVFLDLSLKSPNQDKKACRIPVARSQSVVSLCRCSGMCSEFTQRDGPDSSVVHNMPQMVIHLWDEIHKGQAVRNNTVLPNTLIKSQDTRHKRKLHCSPPPSPRRLCTSFLANHFYAGGIS